jgi:transposase InsO family protein
MNSFKPRSRSGASCARRRHRIVGDPGDGGSEFTAAYFQSCCQAIGQWVRCRVNQTGGLGIVERLNRTFKYEFVFRHEVTTSAELKALVPQFRQWYNQERLHSSLGYQVPWQRFLADVAGLTQRLEEFLGALLPGGGRG